VQGWLCSLGKEDLETNHNNMAGRGLTSQGPIPPYLIKVSRTDPG